MSTEKKNESRNIPQLRTQQKWKIDFPWLDFSNNGMKCLLCCEWLKAIESSKNFNDRFIIGCTNYRLSAVKDHAKSDIHLTSTKKKDKENAEKAGEKYREKVTVKIPDNCPIVKGLNKASVKERESLYKLFEVAYFIAKKGRPFSDYHDFLELEKLHGVKYDLLYNNRNACVDFIRYIKKSLFDISVISKLKRVNFITVLCDGATDVAIIEKECIFILFLDPDNFSPSMTFFSLKDVPSQDAEGIESAIRDAFTENGLSHLLFRMVFFSSDGASVNSGLKHGLIAQFHKNGLIWVLFIWCLSHRLELALKDSLSDAMSDINEVLTFLFYLYKKSSKKLRELRQLHMALKDVYSFENNQVRPSKASGTRWIAHVMRSMAAFVDKHGVFIQHLENVIADTSKQTDRATLEGKRRKMIQASVLLKSCLFLDLLDSAKNFSLCSQHNDADIMLMVDRIEDMKITYQLFYRKFKANPESVFELPHLKKLLNSIVIEDEQVIYQGVKLLRFDVAKASIQNNVLSYVEDILGSLLSRFGALTEEDVEELGVDKRAFSGDTLLQDVCSVLDTRNWILPEGVIANFENVQLHFSKVFESVNRIYDRFEEVLLKASSGINKLFVEKELTHVIIYTITSLNNQTLPPLEIWKLIFSNNQTRGLQNILLIIEICLCAPCSNASLERFFSQMRIVKTDWRNKLSEENLTNLLYIKTEGPTLQEFHDNYCKVAVDLWYNDKDRRLNQSKRKPYRKRIDSKPKYQKLDFDLPSVFDEDINMEESSESESDDEN